MRDNIMSGSLISEKSLRCLEKLAAAGASSPSELDKLDPTVPNHTATIKNPYQAGYVASNVGNRIKGDPARYSLTDKARNLLATKGSTPVQKAASKRYVQRPRYANPPSGANVAGPVVYGSMTTEALKSPCADMLAPATRTGAEQALQIPSRVNDTLHYRDGRTVQTHSNQRA